LKTGKLNRMQYNMPLYGHVNTVTEFMTIYHNSDGQDLAVSKIFYFDDDQFYYERSGDSDLFTRGFRYSSLSRSIFGSHSFCPFDGQKHTLQHDRARP